MPQGYGQTTYTANNPSSVKPLEPTSTQETVCSQPAHSRRTGRSSRHPTGRTQMQDGQSTWSSPDREVRGMPCAQVLQGERGGGIHLTANTKRLSPPLLGRQMPSPLGLAVTLRSETQLEHTMSSSSSHCSAKHLSWDLTKVCSSSLGTIFCRDLWGDHIGARQWTKSCSTTDTSPQPRHWLTWLHRFQLSSS